MSTDTGNTAVSAGSRADSRAAGSGVFADVAGAGNAKSSSASAAGPDVDMVREVAARHVLTVHLELQNQVPIVPAYRDPVFLELTLLRTAWQMLALTTDQAPPGVVVSTVRGLLDGIDRVERARLQDHQ